MAAANHPGCSFRPPNSHGSKYFLVRIPPPKLHKTIYATGGLHRLYQRVLANTGPQNIERGRYTNNDGIFVPQSNMPCLASRYRVLRVLGKGQSSVFIKAEDTFSNNEQVAIKVLHTHYHMLGAQESDCIRRLNQADPYDLAGTLRLRTVFRFDKHYCMVFELLHPRPLTDFFHGLDDTQTMSSLRGVARRVLQTLGFLQQQTVIHADLKPENILLKTDGELSSLKVVDFGNAIHCVHEELSLYYDDFELQTLLYRAPEVMFGLPFGVEIDLWSLGCILAELYIGKPLFAGCDKNEVMQKMISILGPLPEDMCRGGKFFHHLRCFTAKSPRRVHVVDMMKVLQCRNYAFADFLLKLLCYRPNERLTVFEAACHPFLAPELGTAFLLPPKTTSQSYPLVMVDEKSYLHHPAMEDAGLRRHLASTDLLRLGTCGRLHMPTPETASSKPRQVVHVQPLQQSLMPLTAAYSQVVVPHSAPSSSQAVAEKGLGGQWDKQMQNVTANRRGSVTHVESRNSLPTGGRLTSILSAVRNGVLPRSSGHSAQLSHGHPVQRMHSAPAESLHNGAMTGQPYSTAQVEPQQGVKREYPWQESYGVVQQGPAEREEPRQRPASILHGQLPQKASMTASSRPPAPALSYSGPLSRRIARSGMTVSGEPTSLILTHSRRSSREGLQSGVRGDAAPHASSPHTGNRIQTVHEDPRLLSHHQLPRNVKYPQLDDNQINSISSTYVKEEDNFTTDKSASMGHNTRSPDSSSPQQYSTSYSPRAKHRRLHLRGVEHTAAGTRSPKSHFTSAASPAGRASKPAGEKPVLSNVQPAHLARAHHVTPERPGTGVPPAGGVCSPDSPHLQDVSTLTPCSDRANSSSPENGSKDQKMRPLKKRIRTCLFIDGSGESAKSDSSGDRPAFGRSLSASDLMLYKDCKSEDQSQSAAKMDGIIANNNNLNFVPRNRSRLWIRKSHRSSSRSPESSSGSCSPLGRVETNGIVEGDMPTVGTSPASQLPGSRGHAPALQPQPHKHGLAVESGNKTNKWTLRDDNDNDIVTSSVIEELNKSSGTENGAENKSIDDKRRLDICQVNSSPEGNSSSGGASDSDSSTCSMAVTRMHKTQRPGLLRTNNNGVTGQQNANTTSPPKRRQRGRGITHPVLNTTKLKTANSKAKANSTRIPRSTTAPRFVQKYYNTFPSSSDDDSVDKADGSDAQEIDQDLLANEEDSDTNTPDKRHSHSHRKQYTRKRPASSAKKTVSKKKELKSRRATPRKKGSLNETYHVEFSGSESEGPKEEQPLRRPPISNRKKMNSHRKAECFESGVLARQQKKAAPDKTVKSKKVI